MNADRAIVLSLVLTTGAASIDSDVREWYFDRPGWTGTFPITEWTPATGEALVVDGAREFARGFARMSAAVAAFGVIEEYDRKVDAMARRRAEHHLALMKPIPRR